MATTKNITMKQFNGNDYDTLYPQTQGSQIIGSVPIVSGGTGGINATSGMYNLLNGMSTIAPATNDLFPFKDVSGSTSGLVTLTNLITAMGNNGVITTSNLSTQASNLGFSKIHTGSYVGTGTYGASNPCSLTFDSPVQFFILYDGSNRMYVQYSGANGANGINQQSYLLVPRFAKATDIIMFGSGSPNYKIYNKFSFNGNTVSWYSYSTGEPDYPAEASKQFNTSGKTYYYIAIG